MYIYALLEHYLIRGVNLHIIFIVVSLETIFFPFQGTSFGKNIGLKQGGSVCGH